MHRDVTWLLLFVYSAESLTLCKITLRQLDYLNFTYLGFWKTGLCETYSHIVHNVSLNDTICLRCCYSELTLAASDAFLYPSVWSVDVLIMCLSHTMQFYYLSE